MTLPPDRTLHEPGFLAFPFRVGRDGPAQSARVAHVREMIEQVLLTAPGERVFRPAFGVGVHALVFEPARSAVQEVAAKRLRATLTEVLAGEVDPRTITVEFSADGGDRLEIVVGYALATIGRREEHRIALGGGGG
jgi:uncharacterized protein